MERKSLFLQVCNELTPGDQACHQAIADIFQYKVLGRGKPLTVQEIPYRSICFLDSGILSYQRKSKNRRQRHQSLHIYLPGEFISFQPTAETTLHPHCFSAISHCELWAASEERFRHLSSIHPVANILREKIYDQWQQKHLDRIALLTTNPSIKRYHLAKTVLGNQFYQLPKEILASYLHISRKHLARLNRQLLKGK
jgi:CRP-like cAMP-binding protein